MTHAKGNGLEATIQRLVDDGITVIIHKSVPTKWFDETYKVIIHKGFRVSGHSEPRRSIQEALIEAERNLKEEVTRRGIEKEAVS